MIKTKKIILINVMIAFFMMGLGASKANSNIEKYEVSPQMKKLIMGTSFKRSLQKIKGKKIVVYLYAEDEKREPHKYYSCINGEEKKTILKEGHYYLYLYDMSSASFLPERIAVFQEFDGITMNIEGANFFVWPSIDNKQSDIILISQFVSCNGNQYEAYGLNKKLNLKRYWFDDGKKRQDAFYGQIYNQSPEVDGTLIAYMSLNSKLKQYKFSLVGEFGEIKLFPYD